MSSTDPPPPGAAPEMAPDPEEDDLDDLDDVLDDFSSNIRPAAAPSAAVPVSTAPEASGPGRPTATASHAPAPKDAATTAAEDDFAKQLQAGMAELLGELESNPEMAKQFEEMMGQFGQPMGGGGLNMNTTAPASAAALANSTTPSKGTANRSAKTASTEDAFQETIKRTMQRMQQSDTSASAAATTSSNTASEDALFAQMMKELGGGAGGSDDFSSMLLGMMEQLTNKDVLYEPMKELDTKFPTWLSEHEAGGAKAGSVNEADMTRYREQRQLVKEIVGRFERKGYADDTPEDREFIVERMQKMQEAGAPPPELVGDVDLAEKMMGDLDLDAGCPQQ